MNAVDYVMSLSERIDRKTAEAVVSVLGEKKSLELTKNLDKFPPAEKIGISELLRDVILAELKLTYVYSEEYSAFKSFLELFNVQIENINTIYRLFRAEYKKTDPIRYIRSNPYNLVAFSKISFDLIDLIAFGLGYQKTSRERILGAVQAVIYREMENGHCYVREKELLKKLPDILGFDLSPRELLSIATSRLGRRYIWTRDQISREWRKKGIETLYYLRHVYYAEKRAGEVLAKMRLCPPADIDLSEYNLSEEQESAVKKALENRFSVITGGPGTGKTYIVKPLVESFQRIYPGAEVRLCAPTGKAARRLGQAAGMKAETVHAMLKIKSVNKKYSSPYGKNYPFSADLIVVDEASMLDIFMLEKITTAADSNNAKVVFIGDPDQLPPVGPGSPLKDLIKYLPTAELTEIRRRSRGSAITQNAYRLLKGEELEQNEEFQIISAKDITEARSVLLNTADGRKQVLCPMNKGLLGINPLNIPLRNKFNFDNEGQEFAPGDKVICLRNDYQKGVMNGETGRIIDVLYSKGKMLGVTACFDDTGREAFFEAITLPDTLALAYAITIHKSQGSEYPEVLIPVFKEARNMYRYKSLLYTAITRAKEKIYLIDVEEELSNILQSRHVAPYRRTSLGRRIENCLKSKPVWVDHKKESAEELFANLIGAFE